MTEIEWIDSESGAPIPQQSGQSLCSKVNPVSEAEKWLDQNKQSIRDAETIIVLGMGGGYHLKLLTEKFKDRDFIAIEKHAAIADFLSSRSLPQEVAVLSGYPYEELLKNALLKEALKTRIVVLKHPSSFRLNREYYSKIEKLLTGREASGLEDLLKMRLDLRPFFRTLKLNQDHNPNILSIEEAIKARGTPVEKEGIIWLTLRELVR